MIKHKHSLNILLSVVIAAAIIFALGLANHTKNKFEKISPHQGVLDLSQWEPAQSKYINLNGDWEFYWQKLLSYNDLNDHNIKPDLLGKVPRVWNRYELDNRNLPGFGSATYRLRVMNVKAGEELAIRIPTVATAYNLFINEKLIASNGIVSMDQNKHLPEYRPVLAEFITPSEDFDIILQVSNYSYARGGVWYPIFLGSAQIMHEYDKTIGYKDLFLVGAFFIMALYYLCILVFRKESGCLYFVLLSLAAIIRTIIYGDYIINLIFPWAGYPVTVFLDYLTTIWSPVLMVLLLGELFTEQNSPKLNKLFLIYAALMSLFFILFPIHIYTKFTAAFQTVTLTMVAYAFSCVVRAYIARKKDSLLVMAGMLTAALGGLHDILYHNIVILSVMGEFSALGFLVFLFLYAIILARRYSEAFAEVKTLSEKLIEFDKLKDQFLANTSHEIRTPLNAMINIADGIARGAHGKVNQEQKASLAMITSSGKRLANLINDIQDYSKLKYFNLKMNFEAVNLKRTVDSVVGSLISLKPAEVQIFVDIPDDFPYIYADENRLLQILYNLVGNSLKFTKTGYIKISAASTGEYAEICVEDTGLGIPEDKLEEIFDSFHQLEDSLTRRVGGTGLGLSLTKYLVEAHGGKIWVESNLGGGSKFHFSIPLYTGASRKIEREDKTTETEIAAGLYRDDYLQIFPYRYEGDGPHIILVDDNRSNLLSLAAILKLENYSITAVTSSEEFFEQFKGNSDVSLVILDVMLPGLSGYDICREIRKTFSLSEMPILILTARTATNDIVMGMEAGANDYLAKPFDSNELLARVKTLIQLKQSVERSISSELAFLQSQIKPHFIYNVLNTVVSISRYDVEQARKLLIDFGNYLRHSFDFRGISQYVPLKKEIELVRSYLDIEKVQFEERLEVNFVTCDDFEVKVPILILQPLVENAVVHGVLAKREGGRIDVSIEKEEKRLKFSVKDNGVGMEPEKLKKVLNRKGSGIGLQNIDNRLKKLYGKGLQINSIPGVGTEVVWYIPIN